MRTTPRVITADLGPHIAAFTCRINGRPAAVVNRAAAHNPAMRTEALAALLRAGLDAGAILGALHGIHS
jgi:hypothetical protein